MSAVEFSLDGGATQTTGNVTIATEGVHTLASRIIDVAGNASDWRTDTIGIDRTVPTLAVDCGPTGWRNTQPTCSVAATGGLSGLAGVTADGTSVVDGAYAVQAQGATTIHFRAVDGAGNEAAATADVKVDSSAPAPAVKCIADAGTGLDLHRDRQRLHLRRRQPRLLGRRLHAGRDRQRRHLRGQQGLGHGLRERRRRQRRGVRSGHAGRSLGPADRADAAGDAARPSLLRKGGAAAARLVGQLSLSSLPTSTTVDLRPLAIGKGSFQFVFKIKSGTKTKTVTKTQTIKTGYSTRISIALPASSKTSVALTVRRKSGKRWTTYATGSAKL